MTIFHISKCVIIIGDAEPIPIRASLNVDWEPRKAVGKILEINMTPELEAMLTRHVPWCADESMFKVSGSVLVPPNTRLNISCERCLFTHVRENRKFQTMSTPWELTFETRDFVVSNESFAAKYP